MIVAALLAGLFATAAGAYLAHAFRATHADAVININVWDLPLVDVDGAVHVPGDAGCRAMAFVFVTTQCPISNRAIPELNRLVAEFAPRGIELYAVHADRSVSRKAAARHRDQFGLQVPVLLDEAGHVREKLQPTHTPQAIVITPSGTVLYSGAIDDRHISPGRGSQPVQKAWLWEALAAIADGRPVSVPRTNPIGCLLEPRKVARRPTVVTYARHIAPIFQAHCVVCHRDGDVGPFPLDTHDEVVRHAEQIRAVVTNRTMPPWKPAADSPHFRDDLRLMSQQIALVDAWIEAGKPLGKTDDLPPPREFPEGWRLGPPDLVLELPERFPVPADGADIYQYFVLPTGLKTDRLVEAVDFQPGNAQVVHHAGFWFDQSGLAREHDRAQPGPGYSNFGGPGIPGWIGLGNWTPGTTPQRLPEGTGRLLPAGSDLVLQVHYHPTGKPEWDVPRVGLYFAPPDASELVGEIAIGDMTLEIPAGRREHIHRATYKLPVDTRLLDVYPHMHLHGRKIRATAHLPDGSRQDLIHITDWDYAWQPRYAFRQPLELPRGTRIELECVYDNSTGNPYVPNSPPRNVYWGEGADDEMGLVYFQVLPVRPEDYERLTTHNLACYMRTLQAFWHLYPARMARGELPGPARQDRAADRILSN
jgi:mono/diheme cytochrome c family protein